MKMYGFLKPFQSYIFAIPVYIKDDKYYFHKLDTFYRIVEFQEFHISDKTKIVKTKGNDTTFSIGEFGVLSFISDEKIFINAADKIIADIREYINIKYPTSHPYLKSEIDKIVNIMEIENTQEQLS